VAAEEKTFQKLYKGLAITKKKTLGRWGKQPEKRRGRRCKEERACFNEGRGIGRLFFFWKKLKKKPIEKVAEGEVSGIQNENLRNGNGRESC